MNGMPASIGKRFFKISLIWIVVIGISSCESVERRELVKQGNLLIVEIENFRAIHEKLPSSLNEMNVSYDERLFYEKRGADVYVVWFGGKRLGESELYDSSEGKWKTIY